MGEPADKGVYEALNTGFARATRGIMGWLSASNKLHTSGLFVVGRVFAEQPEVKWITGRPMRVDSRREIMDTRTLPHLSRYRFLPGRWGICWARTDLRSCP